MPKEPQSVDLLRFFLLIALILFQFNCIYVSNQELTQKGYLAWVWDDLYGGSKKRTGPPPTDPVEIFQLAREKRYQMAANKLQNPTGSFLDKEGKSIYEYALAEEASPLLSGLIAAKVPLEGGDAWYYAILTGQINALKTMLDGKLDLNQYCRDGNLPLLFAIDIGDPDLVIRLLEHGANPEMSARDGRTVEDAISAKKNRSNLPDVDFNYSEIQKSVNITRFGAKNE